MLLSSSTMHLVTGCIAAVGVGLTVTFMGCDRREECTIVAAEPEIVIDRLVLGRLRTNCYCLRASKTAKQCLVIDTGAGGAEALTDFLKERALTPAAVIFTHGHYDHIGGVTLLRKHFPGVKFVIHKDDAKALRSLVTDFKAALIEREGPVEYAGIELEVIQTPGHTRGGVCFYLKSRGAVFSGATLFARGIGSIDSSGASELTEVIKRRLLVLPEEVQVYPGHGPATTIGREKQSNPFLQ